MATINIGDVLQVVQTYDAPLASVAQNVWHLEQVSGAGSDSDDVLAAILTQQQIAWDEIESIISDDYSATLLELRMWDFVNNRFDGVGTLAVTGMAGISVSDFEPHGVAMLGRIITNAARRQGRTFIPGVIEGSVLTGTLTAASEAALAAYLAIFDTDISVTGGLLSWCTFNVDATSPVFETTSLAAQTVIANTLPSYLTKRKPGVGL